MKISNIDFEEIKFRDLFLKFCLDSCPLKEMEYGSRTVKSLQCYNYLETLKSTDLSITIKDSDNNYLFFCFLNDTKEDYIDLEFCFPVSNIMEELVHDSRLCFYSSCLYAIDFFKKEKIIGKIRRNNKKNPFKVFLKRYVKGLKYIEKQDKNSDSVYLIKDSIIKHCEKLKIKSNWNELFNEIS